MTRLAAFAALAIFAAAPVRAETAAGHYYLEGVMETGSELLLSKDGGFRYYLVYGALDMFAEGDWSQKEDRVLLVTRRKQSNDPEGALQPFERLEMRMIPPPADGKAVLETELWGRNVTYVRHGDADAGD